MILGRFFALATLFGAAPAVQAQVGVWDISYISIATNFIDDADDDITFVYDVFDENRVYAVEIFEATCTTSPSNSVVLTDSANAANRYPNINAAGVTGPDGNRLTTIIDLDKTQITGSNIYDSGTDEIKFCAVVQLLSGADEIKREERVFTVPFDYNPDFAALGDAKNEDVTLANAADAFIEGAPNGGTASATAIDLESFIAACKCDTGVAFASSADCSTNTLDAADNINICIYSKDTDIELVSVPDLDITQTGGAGTKAVMQTNVPSDASITAYLDSASTDVRVIETIVPDEFFYADNIGNVLTVSGVVEVQLVGTTRRRLVKFDTSDARAMRGLSSPPFAKSLFGADNTDTAGEKTEGAFSFDVELTNKEADNEEFIDISSGSAISAAAGALAAIAVSYFW